MQMRAKCVISKSIEASDASVAASKSLIRATVLAEASNEAVLIAC